MKSDFQERREARLERCKDLAAKKAVESDRLWDSAQKMASYIPMGQPILVGHHSERADRSYRAKINRTEERAWEADKTAKYYAGKVKMIESNYAISSDDPEALTLLKEKLAKLESLQTEMIETNKLVRKNDKAGLAAMGFSEAKITRLFTPNCFGTLGYERFELTNNGATIRATKKRIDGLQKLSTMETTERTINGVRLVFNVEDNRLQMFFDGKPSDEIRAMCKRSGFHWSPMVGAWMRQLSNSAIYYAKEIAGKVSE